MAEIKVVDSKGAEISPKEETVKTPETVKTFSNGELDRVAVSQVLDMDGKELSKHKDKLDVIVKWAKSQGDIEDMTHLKWIVRNMESRLGSPNFGETRIARLARFAYLNLETQKLEKEKLDLLR